MTYPEVMHRDGQQVTRQYTYFSNLPWGHLESGIPLVLVLGVEFTAVQDLDAFCQDLVNEADIHVANFQLVPVIVGVKC